MASEQKDWYNKDRVAIKGSVVLNHWNKTASPSALRRIAHSKAPFEQNNKRELAAARLDRLTSSWTTTNISMNADLYRNLDTIRARANDLARNNPYAKRYLQMVVANVIGGDGVRLQSRIYDSPKEPDTIANDAVESAFATWGKKGVCDVTGRLSWRDLEAQVTENVARDGEALIRKVRGKTANNPFGFALQILDINRLDTTLMRAPEQGRGRVIMGVEVNEFFRPTHYWLKEKNPAEMYMTGVSNTTLHLRIPADEIIHIFKQEYPEQVRGLPWMHAGMTLLNHLGAYQEAAVIAARVGAAKMGFFTTPDGDPRPLQDGENDGYEDNIPYTEADPGTFGVLPEGVSFESFNPDYPHQMFGEFIKACLRGVASSWNVAYHSLGNDLEGVNFSSIRSGTLEERDQWMTTQRWLIDSFHEQVYTDWLQSALAFGQVMLTNGNALPISNYKKFSQHTWQARRWQWVDPYKDMQTAVLAIHQRLKSPQQVCAELGMDYEDVLVQCKQAEDLAAKFGLQPLQPANPDNTTVQVENNI
jgi:lambda family phage portal protein